MALATAAARGTAAWARPALSVQGGGRRLIADLACGSPYVTGKRCAHFPLARGSLPPASSVRHGLAVSASASLSGICARHVMGVHGKPERQIGWVLCATGRMSEPGPPGFRGELPPASALPSPPQTAAAGAKPSYHLWMPRHPRQTQKVLVNSNFLLLVHPPWAISRHPRVQHSP